MTINIPRLPVYTTEEGIKRINQNMQNLKNWTEISKLIPGNLKKSKKLKKTGISGIFSASLELTKDGLIKMMQKKIFDKVLIKQNNE